MEKRVFRVEGMACNNCKKRVEDALNALDGVSSAVASVEKKQVEVEFNPAVVAPAQMQETVEDCGYDMAI